MSAAIRGISSMATRAVLAELAAAYQQRAGVAVQIESVGGVDAARRVQAGEPFDLVVLASDAIDKLAAGGAILAGSKVDLVHSPVAVAVRAGAPAPDIATEDALRRAVEARRQHRLFHGAERHRPDATVPALGHCRRDRTAPGAGAARRAGRPAGRQW